MPDTTPGELAAPPAAPASAYAADMPPRAVLAARAAIAVTRVIRDITISRSVQAAHCRFLYFSFGAYGPTLR
ncbi:hypothetical protein TPA0598_08_02080 [Streptomyces lydicamycinicus]|uniref:Uncharacterized protein n=1 Tax=Streptomyces lydicamycinicus TaxID=1546107 RepID=A0A0P4RCJ7_9ACTN|nr:hypothetical protein TPA0598_08_02080 [Streptomyces lydicamycinicus]